MHIDIRRRRMAGVHDFLATTKPWHAQRYTICLRFDWIIDCVCVELYLINGFTSHAYVYNAPQTCRPNTSHDVFHSESWNPSAKQLFKYIRVVHRT